MILANCYICSLGHLKMCSVVFCFYYRPWTGSSTSGIKTTLNGEGRNKQNALRRIISAYSAGQIPVNEESNTPVRLRATPGSICQRYRITTRPMPGRWRHNVFRSDNWGKAQPHWTRCPARPRPIAKHNAIRGKACRQRC